MNDEFRLELERYFDGELSPDRHAEVARLLSESVEARHYLGQLGRLRSLARCHEFAAGRQSTGRPVQSSSSRSPDPRVWAVAVAALAASVAAVLLWRIPPAPVTSGAVAESHRDRHGCPRSWPYPTVPSRSRRSTSTPGRTGTCGVLRRRRMRCSSPGPARGSGWPPSKSSPWIWPTPPPDWPGIWNPSPCFIRPRPAAEAVSSDMGDGPARRRRAPESNPGMNHGGTETQRRREKSSKSLNGILCVSVPPWFIPRSCTQSIRRVSISVATD